MTEQEARAAADAARRRFSISLGLKAASAERRWIELTHGDPNRPSDTPAPVRDALVWIVHYPRDGRSGSVELAIEDSTGQVVRVERSR